MSEEERKKGYARTEKLMRESGHHLVLHDPDPARERRMKEQMEREDAAGEVPPFEAKGLPPGAQKQIESGHRKKQALLQEATRNHRQEWADVTKVTVYASAPGKDYDTVRIEKADGKVITIRGEWGSAVVSTLSEEAH